jgi:hypothetical protein
VNVTLGIPRLREIIMTASRKIATPAMRLALLPHVTRQGVLSLLLCLSLPSLPVSRHSGLYVLSGGLCPDAEQLAREMSRMTLHQFVREVMVTEQWTSHPGVRLSLYTSLSLSLWLRLLLC